MGSLPPVFVEFLGITGGFKTAVKEVQREITKVERTGGGTFAKFGAGAAKGLGIVGVAAALAAVKAVAMASTFQGEMTLLVTACGEAQGQLKGLESGALAIARATGMGSDQIAAGLYIVEKAGYRAGDALKITKAAAEGAVAEGVDMTTMTTALTSIMATYHMKASDAVSATNSLVAAGGMSKTTMQEFASSLSTVLPLAYAAKLSFAQVGAAIATMTQHGTSAQQATQDLANTIRNLQNPNQVAMKAMQQMGVSVLDVTRNLGKRGLTGTLDVFTAALAKHSKGGLIYVTAMKQSQAATQDLQLALKAMPSGLAALSKGFLDGTVPMIDYRKKIRGFGADGYAMGSQFLALTGKARGFNDLLKSGSPVIRTQAAALAQMMGGSTALNTALMLTGANMPGFTDRVARLGAAGRQSGKDIATWATTSGTLRVQLNKAKQAIETGMIAVGMKLIPIVERLITVIGKELSHVIKDVTQWFERNKKTLTEVAHIVGAVLVVAFRAAVDIFKDIVHVGQGVLHFFEKHKSVAVVLGAALGGLALALMALSVAEIITAIASVDLTGVFAAMSAVLLVNPFVLAVVAIAALAAGLYEAYKHSKTFRDIVGDVGKALKVVWHDVLEPVVDFFKKHWKAAIEIALAVFLPFIGLPLLIITHWKQILHFFERLPSMILNFLVGLPGKMLRFSEDVLKGFVHGLSIAIPWVLNFFLVTLPFAVLDALKTANIWLIKTGWKLLKGLIDGIMSIAPKLWDFWIKLPGRTISFLAHLGTTLVKTGWNLLHGLYQGVLNLFPTIVSWFAGLPWKVLGWLKDAASWLLHVGEDLIHGLLNGIENAAEWLWNMLKDFAGNIVHHIEKFFGISSPSKVFAKIGGHLVTGLAKGITDNKHHAVTAMASLATDISNTNFGMPGAGLGGPASTAALRGVRGASLANAPTYVLQMTVQGTVIAENDLISKVEQGFLRMGARRAGQRTYQPYVRN